MKNQVLFTVITPCFNSEKTIEQTLDSMVKQTYDHYEYIIVDGASTDRTLEIIKRYEQLFQGRMRYISEKDNGIGDAMIKGIRMARGDMVGFLNSDDYYEINALEEAAKAYDEKEKYQILYGMMRIVNPAGEERSIVFNHQRLLPQETLMFPSSFYSRSIYQDKFIPDISWKLAGDYEFFVRANNDKEIRFIPVYSILCNFRLGGASNSSKGAEMEQVKIQYQYGIIPKKVYWMQMIRLRITEFVKKHMMKG